jgi:hypothetical protein
MGACLTDIHTYEQVKSYSATVGMAIFGLKYKRPNPNCDAQLELGVSVCGTIAENRKLAESSGVESFEDLARVEAFRSAEQWRRVDPDQVAALANEAPVVRAILVRIRDGNDVSAAEMDRASSFFRALYKAT